jgi:hypothetical protein
MFVALAVATLCSLAQAPSNVELRAALDALREGQPGETRFEAAKPRLTELLASESDFFVEGAAYLVGQHRLGEFAPALVDALRTEAQRPKGKSTKAYSLLLDALIQLDHTAPAELILARASEEYAEFVYLALACEKDDQRAADNLARFVALGMRSESAYWAAAIELTAARDPRIVDELLAGAPWEFALGLRDPGSDALASERFSARFSCSSHDQWPPVVRYRVELPSLTGPLDGIRHERTEHARSTSRTIGLRLEERVGWRLRLLRELHSGVTAFPPSAFEIYLDDVNSLSKAGHAHVAVLHSEVSRLAHKLADLGLIADAQVASNRATFRVEVYDLRSDRRPRLSAPTDTESVRFVRM